MKLEIKIVYLWKHEKSNINEADEHSMSSTFGQNSIRPSQT